MVLFSEGQILSASEIPSLPNTLHKAGELFEEFAPEGGEISQKGASRHY
jgi:hypothetical protein